MYEWLLAEWGSVKNVRGSRDGCPSVVQYLDCDSCVVAEWSNTYLHTLSIAFGRCVFSVACMPPGSSKNHHADCVRALTGVHLHCRAPLHQDLKATQQSLDIQMVHTARQKDLIDTLQSRIAELEALLDASQQGTSQNQSEPNASQQLLMEMNTRAELLVKGLASTEHVLSTWMVGPHPNPEQPASRPCMCRQLRLRVRSLWPQHLASGNNRTTYCNEPRGRGACYNERTMVLENAARIAPSPSANHLEERLLEQAQARAPFSPLLGGGGHSRGIPQWVMVDI